MAPAFFKILLDPSATYMSLPPDFVSLHLENKIPDDPIIRFANGKYSWRLKIKKIGDGYCFTNGWNNVVKDIQLCFADFIFFRLVDRFTFIMWIYSPDGCEKLLPQNIEHDEDVACEFINVDENDKVKKEDSDDCDYDGNNDEVNVDDVMIEENGDDDDDDPFFIAIMNRTHTKLLRFPAGFEVLAGIDGEGTLTMKNLAGKEWVTGLRLDKSYRASIRYYISCGWRHFRRQNGLSEGDECVFKFIKSEGKLLLAKLIKNKWPVKPPPQSGEFPVKKVVKTWRAVMIREQRTCSGEQQCNGGVTTGKKNRGIGSV